MARKKKVDDEEQEYDVLLGFVHEFKFTSQEHLTRMSGHPVEGRVYRILKDPYGWRLHIGRENNKEGLDGLFLGDIGVYTVSTGFLESEQRLYTFKIEVITPTNYLKLPIADDDRAQVLNWIESGNTDLWDGLEKEKTGEQHVVRTGTDVLKLLLTGQIKPNNGTQTASGHSASIIDRERALEASLTLLTHFKNKKTDELVALFDAMYVRILKTLEQ